MFRSSKPSMHVDQINGSNGEGVDDNLVTIDRFSHSIGCSSPFPIGKSVRKYDPIAREPVHHWFSSSFRRSMGKPTTLVYEPYISPMIHSPCS